VQVRLLGPVDAVVDGAVRPVSGLRRKAVLAALALHPGEVVSADRLIDMVWGGKAPATAANALQSHVSYLRGVLGARTAIVARPPGYVLTIPPEATDVQAADRLIRQGRQCADPARAAPRLRAALALWRGRPLDDVAGIPWLDEQAERLDEARLAAVQALVEVRLALGEHVQLVPELELLAQQNPFREHLHGQLMLALYGAGRQADALAAYRRLRRTLRAELGIDPSPAVRDLEAAILRQDAAVGPPAVPVTVPPAPVLGSVPAQLPLVVPAFAGRAREIDQLDALLAGGVANGGWPAAVVVSAVSGTAGVGKTALALRWAHRVAGQFPDGQLYVNLRGFDPGGSAVEPAEALRGFLEAFGVAGQRIPDGLAAQAALYRSVLAGKRVLVVLDNARDAGQVRPLLPGSAGCLAVVTSRNELTPLVVTEGAHLLTLDLLTPADAHDLLARRLGPHRVAAEPAAVDEIITRCVRLPLALAITAARAAARPGLPLATLAADLRDAADALNPFAGDDAATNLRAVFSLSYQTVSGATARLFRLLGPHAGPSITAPAAASLAGLSQPQVQPMLAELCRAQLLSEHTPGRYTFHDLLRAYATEQAHRDESRDDQRAALHRLLDHYLHTAHAAATALHPPFSHVTVAAAQTGVAPQTFADTTAAQKWFDAELPVLLAAIDWAARTGFPTHAWQLAWVTAGPLDRLGHWPDWETAGRTALAAVRQAGDQLGQAHAHRDLGRVYSRLRRHDDARRHLTQAVDLFAQLDDHTGQAHAHLNFSQALERSGQVDDALGHSRRALALFESAGHLAGQAFVRNAVGWQHALLGDYRRAIDLCQQALVGLQEIGDHQGEADTWDSLGYAHHHLDHHQEAIACYHQALQLFATSNDRYATAATLANLGDSHHAAGDPDAARTAWQDALTILTELGHCDTDRLRAKLRDLAAVTARSRAETCARVGF
jgi:DNA-binding SARP family transcriptional activator/Flp pilus assembly protein TadD